MTVAMAVIVTTHASTLAEALTVVVMGGLLQVLLGVFKVGRFVAYTPHVVISGLMSGIGIIIMLIQVLPFIGAPVSPEGPMGAVRELPAALGNINYSALGIALATLAIGILWPPRLARLLPAPIVDLVTAVAMVIEQLIEVATRADTEIIVTGLSGSIGHTFDTLHILRRVPENRIVETLDQAREIAAGLLDDQTR